MEKRRSNGNELFSLVIAGFCCGGGGNDGVGITRNGKTNVYKHISAQNEWIKQSYEQAKERRNILHLLASTNQQQACTYDFCTHNSTPIVNVPMKMCEFTTAHILHLKWPGCNIATRIK